MVLDKFRLDGKVAIITGASKGLGKVMAIALAEAGADIVGAARNFSLLEGTKKEIENIGRKSLIIRTDITKQDEVEFMVKKSIEEFGKIDILVNNSGIAVDKPLIESTQKEWESVINTNLTGTFLCTQKVGKFMIEKGGGGKIINIASNFGVIGTANLVSYCVSKAGIIQFTRALAVEWARYNINVNTIAPGFFYTDLNAYAFENEKIRDAALKQIPFRRLGKFEELGPLVVYLASPASDYITGEVIFIDGGRQAK